MKIYLTPADAARILGVTPSNVRVLVLKGELTPDAKTERNIRLFERETVESLLRKRAERRQP